MKDAYMDPQVDAAFWYIGKHRDLYNRALDKTRSHGTPYTPRHAWGSPPDAA